MRPEIDELLGERRLCVIGALRVGAVIFGDAPERRDHLRDLFAAADLRLAGLQRLDIGREHLLALLDEAGDVARKRLDVRKRRGGRLGCGNGGGRARGRRLCRRRRGGGRDDQRSRRRGVRAIRESWLRLRGASARPRGTRLAARRDRRGFGDGGGGGWKLRRRGGCVGEAGRRGGRTWRLRPWAACLRPCARAEICRA